MVLVFLYGQAATGKLTVARELARTTALPVFHNHIAVDAALTLFDFGTPGFVALREGVWLAAIEQAARHARSMIFTFHPEASVPPDFVERVAGIVAEHGGDILFVRLICDDDVIEQRISNASRSQFRKLTSPDMFRRLQAAGAFDYPALPADVTVDTTHNSAAQCAAAIAGHLSNHPRSL
jgi:hypothetical protein